MSRPFVVIDAPQRSPEWYQARCGRLTASAAGDMLAKLKGSGEAAARRDLRTRLALEQITGIPEEDGYINADMQRGIDNEADARAAYECEVGEMVTEVGFLAHAELPIGCSPDGIVADWRGVLEIKCPRPANHTKYLRAKTLPAEHAPQIMHALLVTGAEFVDFVSWCPVMPEALRFFSVRAHRGDFDLTAYELTVRMFMSEVQREADDLIALEAERKAARLTAV